jgi:hypothetical protein
LFSIDRVSVVFGGFSILEVAVYPSYTIFFLATWQKRPFYQQQKRSVAIGCIFNLQAVQI